MSRSDLNPMSSNPILQPERSLGASGAEPDTNDPVEVKAFELWRSGRADEAVALLEQEIGRAAKTRADQPRPPADAVPHQMAIPSRQLALIAPELTGAPKTALPALVASRGFGGASVMAAPARRSGIWAVAMMSIAVVALVVALWPNRDARSGGPPVAAAEKPVLPAAMEKPVVAATTDQPAAAFKPPLPSAGAPAETASSATTAKSAVEPTMRPAAERPEPASEPQPAPPPASSLATASADDGADTKQEAGSPAPPTEEASLETPTGAAADIAAAPVPRPAPAVRPTPDISAKRRAAESATSARLARNRALAAAYAQKRRAAAQSVGRPAGIPVIGDGIADGVPPEFRAPDDGPVILLGGRGLP